MNCCCCCSCSTTSNGEQPERPPERPPEKPPERCVRYRVTIDSIDVSSIDDGFLGGTLETRWTFVVNGQGRTWDHQDLDRGHHNIGVSFFVDVPVGSSTISISVSGIEEDPFANDDLPGFTRVHGQADQWGLGSHSAGGSNSSITYSMNYTITCVESSSTFTIGREVLLAYGQQKAEQRGVDATDRTALSWALSRFERDGWEVIDASDEEFVVKGMGTLPRTIEEELR